MFRRVREHDILCHDMGKACAGIIQETAPQRRIRHHTGGGRARTGPAEALLISAPERGMPARCGVQRSVDRFRLPVGSRPGGVKSDHIAHAFEKQRVLAGLRAQP